MANTTNFSVRMDSDVKKQSEALFGELGMNLTTAINVFLRQSLRVGGFPFDVTVNVPNAVTMAAMQEAEAEKIKVQERICVKSMLDPHVGVLYSTNFAHFFGERSYKDFNVTKRLERLVHIRAFISQYVDEKELAKTAKIEGSFNYGSLLNEWVSFASRYPKDKAIEKFCEYLKNHNLLKAGSEPEPESNGVIPDEVVRLLEPYGGIDHVILNLKDGVESITKCTFKQGEDYDGGVINVAYASTTSKDATCVIQVNANINNGTDDHCIFIPIKGKGTCKQKTFWLGH